MSRFLFVNAEFLVYSVCTAEYSWELTCICWKWNSMAVFWTWLQCSVVPLYCHRCWYMVASGEVMFYQEFYLKLHRKFLLWGFGRWLYIYRGAVLGFDFILSELLDHSLFCSAHCLSRLYVSCDKRHVRCLCFSFSCQWLISKRCGNSLCCRISSVMWNDGINLTAQYEQMQQVKPVEM
jgi:hypothetical protein